MNTIIGPGGLVCSALVLGESTSVMTRLDTVEKLPPHRDQSVTAKLARNEMEQSIARIQIDQALKLATASAITSKMHLCYKLLVWREKVMENSIAKGGYST